MLANLWDITRKSKKEDEVVSVLDFVTDPFSLENSGSFLLRILLGIFSGLKFYKEFQKILYSKM